MNIIRLSKEHIEECADLFIDVFTKAPWNDTYNSKGQVISYFQNYINNNYFVGYGLKDQNCMIAISVGMKKPWINGMEYYKCSHSPRYRTNFHCPGCSGNE